MQKKWTVLDNNIELAEQLAADAKISRQLANILIHRGITDAKTAAAFLHPESEQEFYDPFLMKDMDIAVKRIIKAILGEEKIIIYGDYDVDGITAVSVLYRCLKKLKANVEYYIPDRQEEGYGFNSKALQSICEQGVSLLISVDCGISANETVAEFKDKLSVIITDHHIPSEILPEALAVIDPHRPDCTYPDKDLAGVGVSFKLCQALFRAMKNRNYVDDLELVALGTIADIVPLLGENRRIAREGLIKMAETQNIGLKALLAISAFDCNNIKSDNIAFGIAPRLNAAGRLASAKIGVDLLLTKDYKLANQLADELNTANKERQAIEQAITKEVEAEIAKIDVKKKNILVICGHNWHMGVIGIVASRLVDRYYLPAVVISIDNGVAKGSCRSIKNFSIYDALKHCEDLLTTFGGHPMAAGLTLAEADIPKFIERIEKYAADVINADDFLPEISVEAEIDPNTLSFSFLEELNLLEPFGMGNPRPLFAGHQLTACMGRAVGRESNHLFFAFSMERNAVKAIAWNKAQYLEAVNSVPFDVVYAPEINEWQGRSNIQCKLHDLRIFDDGEPIDLDGLRRMYRCLKNNCGEDGVLPLSAEDVALKCCLPVNKALTGWQIFKEIKLLSDAGTGDALFNAPPEGAKLDLNASPTFKELQGSC